MHYLVRHSSTDSQSCMLAACLPACRWVLVADGWPNSLIMLLIVQEWESERLKRIAHCEQERTKGRSIKVNGFCQPVPYCSDGGMSYLEWFAVWTSSIVRCWKYEVKRRSGTGSVLFVLLYENVTDPVPKWRVWGSVLRIGRSTDANEWIIPEVTVVLGSLTCIL